MVFIVMAFVVFLLFYSLTYSKSENKPEKINIYKNICQ